MRMLKKTLILCTLLGAGGLAQAQVNLPDPTLPGASHNSAVRIVATSEIMIDRSIRRWLRAHYPGWQADPYEIQEMGPERYAVVNITAPNNPGRRIYFRLISSQADPEAHDSSFPF
jgi:hypothetical protein